MSNPTPPPAGTGGSKEYSNALSAALGGLKDLFTVGDPPLALIPFQAALAGPDDAAIATLVLAKLAVLSRT